MPNELLPRLALPALVPAPGGAVLCADDGACRRIGFDEACALLAKDPSLIASFSRALLEGLSDGQSDDEFNATLENSIAEIYRASAH